MRELCILSTLFLSPMNKNSVLGELRVSKLAVIREEICRTAFCTGWCVSRSWTGKMRKLLGVVCIKVMVKGKGETRVLRGQFTRWKAEDKERSLEKRRRRRYRRTRSVITSDTEGARWQVRHKPVDQLKTEPWMPNQDERRVSKMLWSMVSKAAERSKRHRHDNCCDPITLMRWPWTYRRAVSVELCVQ